MKKINYGDWFLDLAIVEDLDIDRRQTIHNYYRDMLHHHGQEEMARSLFNTLRQAGYIKSILQEDRDKKLGELING